MSVALGRHEIEVEVVDRDGASRLTIMSRPMTVHHRVDGSVFVVLDGRRRTIIRRENGSFYLCARVDRNA